MAATQALSTSEARRIALRAQQFGLARPRGKPSVAQLRRLVQALGAIQIDAVSVLVRSHYLPLYSRIGPYPRHLLDRLTYERREAFEYWAHAASIVAIELQPALRWRMAGNAAHKHWVALQARIERERPGYLAAVMKEIAERGPLAFTDLSDPARREKVQTKYADSSLLWSRWSDGKSVLEGLFGSGQIAAADRRGFERRYDLTERVIPADVLAQPTPTEQDGQRTLVLRAATALGLATVKDVADYFRLPIATTQARLRELVDSGDLQTVSVEGWRMPAFLHPDADAAAVSARALLSPFDSLIWERARTERLFGFRHVFELYVKASTRRYGYYVLPFLLGEEIVARVDLKADQRRRKLLVLGAFVEPGASVRTVAGELAQELRDMAGWLELDGVEVADNGDLAAELRRARP
jgi:uncharacterized protein